MNKVLDEKHKYLSNFFKTAIENNRLFHSLIFFGGNNYIQYAAALEISRQLNCLKDKREDCSCLNCKWIRENKHPAVMTISKIDNKNDTSKTVISEEQANIVLDTLINASDYHRVFIFCDAEIKQLLADERREYEEFVKTGFNLPQTVVEDKVWHPSGLNSVNFSSVAANAMLKSIEEPPSNVTFIFLTNNKDDLIRTIVSRSQAFFIPDFKQKNYDCDFFKNYFNSYPIFNGALEFSQTLLSYQTAHNLSPVYITDCIQYYLTEILKNNFDNQVLINKIFADIKEVEKSKKMLQSYIKEQNVYEDLAFYFEKR